MPKKKNNEESHHKNDPNVMGLRAEVQEQPICRTLEELSLIHISEPTRH